MEIGKFYTFGDVVIQAIKTNNCAQSGFYCKSKSSDNEHHFCNVVGPEITIPEMVERGEIKKGDLVKCFKKGHIFGVNGTFEGVIYDIFTSVTDAGLRTFQGIIPNWALSPAEIEELKK